MIGIPYIQSLFQAILSQSLVMQGRFFLCPKQAAELNSANISEIVTGIPSDTKYPVALLMPPRKIGNFQFSGEEVAGTQIGYNTYLMQMLFLRPAQYTTYNQPGTPLPNTPIPTHTVPETWHDMTRCAEDFLQVLRQVLRSHRIMALQISENATQTIVPVTEIGNDKVTGVLLNFNILVNGGCDIEDYPSDYLQLIEVPELVDTHQTHVNN